MPGMPSRSKHFTSSVAARSAVLDSEPLQTSDGYGLPTDC